MHKINLAILKRNHDPTSLMVYLNNITKELGNFDLHIQYFSENTEIPKSCNLIWEPALAMRRIPKIYKKNDLPIVASIHGVKSYSLPINEIATNIYTRIYELLLKQQLSADWKWFKNRMTKVVAVSEYGANEVIKAFDIPKSKVDFIYNGIDHSIFNLEVMPIKHEKTYFFHVSTNNPLKNVSRIIEAYNDISSPKPDLVLATPGFKIKKRTEGIYIINSLLSQAELARWYKGAIALVMPSLRETFGMPLIEAMACGCPVITSNITGCSEISGKAALKVNPRSVNEIRTSMEMFIHDKSIKKELSNEGIKQSEKFSWTKSAAQFYKLFKSVQYGRV
ncbi:glycosyltransferase family 1 protein [Fulvivirgaceae bacterium BMA10]|uniref:Glycosyltransferase family 1 protein n=1 Tax=Splendidivirga corallicola TaxID=3051826 RepID=A0ABT8KKG5_9BACT|nr:glycosyltransferase family 1 protein [Fulvivirgaceae bacterium BMA10]